MSRVTVIAGVGPGLGESLARKFAREGCPVALFARSKDYLKDLASDLEKDGGSALPVKVDLTSPKDIRSGFERVKKELGSVDILINHASAANWKGIQDTSADEFEHSWRVTTFSGFLCSKQVVEDMIQRESGTILFTGATSSVRGGSRQHRVCLRQIWDARYGAIHGAGIGSARHPRGTYHH
jgi:NAD(P)-dependent dehydrogenase (short-subunit alcohol dehydrogenase family)